ncbi:hypothetical protein Tco_1111395 [Tanacetum coccineum]|uniref:Uncharacterized protein n=1 Tax=Tanacetum coccineum TaxID=301880 RepID=A0ABQ5ILJ7_9ASTR
MNGINEAESVWTVNVVVVEKVRCMMFGNCEICGMDMLDEGRVDMGVIGVSAVLFGGVDWECVDVLVSGIVGGGD